MFTQKILALSMMAARRTYCKDRTAAINWIHSRLLQTYPVNTSLEKDTEYGIDILYLTYSSSWLIDLLSYSLFHLPDFNQLARQA